MKNEEFIYGLHPVMEAIRSGAELDKILVRKGLRGDQVIEILDLARQLQIPVQTVPVEKLNRVTPKNHQGLIAYISKVTYYQIEDIIQGLFETGKSPLILILDEITDVRNFGAISRTAECAGVHAIVIPFRGSAQINEEAIRTSSGALLTVPICRAHNLRDVALYLKNSGVQLIGASEKGSDLYYRCNLGNPVAFILGSEEKGISTDLLKLTDELVKIPMQGEIASLNVSVASGVLLFEAVRQRTL